MLHTINVLTIDRYQEYWLNYHKMNITLLLHSWCIKNVLHISIPMSHYHILILNNNTKMSKSSIRKKNINIIHQRQIEGTTQFKHFNGSGISIYVGYVGTPVSSFSLILYYLCFNEYLYLNNFFEKYNDVRAY